MPQLVINKPTRERRISLAEWAAMPEDDEGELVDGRLVEEEMANPIHEAIIAWLIHILTSWVDPREGFVFGSDLKFAATPQRGRKADASIYLAGTPLPPVRGPVETPPDIIIEVVSPTLKDGRRDRVEKMDEYAAFGARWYWLVDPQLRSLEIYELGADRRYIRALGATDGVVAPIPGCEALSIDLNALWRRIDRLAPQQPPENE
jgi:Uma2 family endonuclease